MYFPLVKADHVFCLCGSLCLLGVACLSCCHTFLSTLSKRRQRSRALCPSVFWTKVGNRRECSPTHTLPFVFYIGNWGIVDRDRNWEIRSFIVHLWVFPSCVKWSWKSWNFLEKCRVTNGYWLKGEFGFPVPLIAFLFCLKFIRKTKKAQFLYFLRLHRSEVCHLFSLFPPSWTPSNLRLCLHYLM